MNAIRGLALIAHVVDYGTMIKVVIEAVLAGIATTLTKVLIDWVKRKLEGKPSSYVRRRGRFEPVIDGDANEGARNFVKLRLKFVKKKQFTDSRKSTFDRLFNA